MKRFVLATAMLAATVPAGVARAQALPPEQRLTAEQMAQARGGFDLPGGGSVTIGVTTTTRIDGREILRSSLNLDNGPAREQVSADRDGSGVSPVAVAVDGAGLATRDGVVRVRSAADGVRVDLAGDAVAVSHLLGGALGSVVANSGNDRAIDVTTSVDIGLGGIRPDAVGSGAVQVDNLALDATAGLVR